MACRGVFFALTDSEAARLLDADGDEAVLEVVREDIEERWDEEWLCETDKAWDAMHRCLSDGTLCADGSARASLVLGGRPLHRGDAYIVSFLDPGRVRVALDSVRDLDEDWFRSRFATLVAHGYDGPHDDDDFACTWEYFVSVRAFFARAAETGRSVVFMVDQ